MVLKNGDIMQVLCCLLLGSSVLLSDANTQKTYDGLFFLVIISLISLSVVGYNILNFLRHSRIAALVRNRPTTPLKEMGTGFREIRATLKAQDEPFISPITGVRCALYDLEVDRQEKKANTTST